MTGLPWFERGLPRDLRNTARETRARFEYQDACVVLRCIPNLLPGGHVAAVVVEWTSDYVLLAGDGRVELVSVKHREEDQPPWNFGDLVKEHVFRDLHSIWMQIGEDGDYVFESNRGFSRALRSAVERAANPGAREAVKLADAIEVSAEEVARFASRLILPAEPVPDRRHIHDVATARLAAVMPQLGLDPRLARVCVTALEERVAAVAVDRPLEPERRVQALAGLMREVRDHGAPSVEDFMLTMDELREVAADGYTTRQAAYDLRKLRGKGLAHKPGRTRRYHLPPDAARTIAALLALRDHVIAPILAGVRSPRMGRKPQNWTAVDRDYEALRIDMQTLFTHVGIAALPAAA